MGSSTWRWSDGSLLDAEGARALRAEATQEHRYLLLLSHMRSYSSLLAHLLGSSPEVNGYGESLVRYRHPLGPWQLRQSIRRATGQPLRPGWLLDKVLHNHIRPLDRWVGAERVRALIFLRRPERTLQSLLTIARRKGGEHPFNDPQVCCDYYVSRLHRLRQDGERLGRRAAYFDAEALVERPRALLDALGGWLGLAAPLSTDYRLGRRTGEEGFGDWLPNIRAGHVLGVQATTIRSLVAIDRAVSAEAEAAWRRCRASLRRQCDSPAVGLMD